MSVFALICPGNPGKGRCDRSMRVRQQVCNQTRRGRCEVAVCRCGVLLKGLNMFCGEIFAYPFYLQKQLASQTVPFFFFCSDAVCKYWPYLQRVVDHCPEFEDFLNMRPFLSTMHAKVHSWLCEVIMTIRCISYHFYHTLWLSVLCPYFLFSKWWHSCKCVTVKMGGAQSRRSRNNNWGGGWTGKQLPLSSSHMFQVHVKSWYAFFMYSCVKIETPSQHIFCLFWV